jgi:hypothetical protein
VERTRSTAVHEAPSRRAFSVPRGLPVLLVRGPRRRPPEPQFGRREPLRSGGARGHARAHGHARKTPTGLPAVGSALPQAVRRAASMPATGGAPRRNVDHLPADSVPAAQCRSSRVGPSSMRCVRSEYSEYPECSEVRVRRRRRVVGYPQAVHRRLHAAGLGGVLSGVLSGVLKGTPRVLSAALQGCSGVLSGVLSGMLRGYSRGAASHAHADRRHARPQT